MPRAKGKKKKEPAAPAPPGTDEPGRAERPGLPAPDSIVGVKQFERGGKVYRIIKTDERDEYDKPEKK